MRVAECLVIRTLWGPNTTKLRGARPATREDRVSNGQGQEILAKDSAKEAVCESAVPDISRIPESRAREQQ